MRSDLFLFLTFKRGRGQASSPSFYLSSARILREYLDIGLSSAASGPVFQPYPRQPGQPSMVQRFFQPTAMLNSASRSSRSIPSSTGT